MLITRGSTYEEVYNSFRWNVPAKYNIANDVCDRWADDPERIALVYEDENKKVERFTYKQIQRYANQLANTLRGLGLQRQDAVTLLLAQDPEAAIAHVACWKAGMVSCPTSVLFGGDAITYRVNDSGARVLITDAANYDKVAAVRGDCPTLEHVLVVDGSPDGASNFWDTIASADESFTNVETDAEERAWISYTSGTTGLPKGSVQPHRMMLGHMPGLEFAFDFFPQPNDVIWSPADWAWMAGLMDIIMPGWFHGITVVASAMKGFDTEEAYRMLSDHKVSIALLTPTMLKLMRQVPNPKDKYALKLRAVMSGGEAVGTELLDWAKRELDLNINEVFGQTECNMVLGNNGKLMKVKPGSLGKSLPGHQCAIVDDAGQIVPPGTPGHIAVKRPDPVMLLEYLNRPDATEEKFIGDWLITGDTGTMDEDGYFWFGGRADDVITSSGYRIGPGEIEDALLKHDAVQMVAVIGVPDPVRTEVIKAFVIPAPGVEPSDDLVEELRNDVRGRLAKHEVPRFIEFVDSLPMTTTGKIMRRELRDRETKGS
ncbi:MAG: AMP-binding protein [Myxococcales bacterium]|nr:AMP-binding protein [Myxococcales bacterium]